MRRELQMYRSVVRDAMSPPPPALPAGMDCGSAVARMAALAASCATIVDTDDRPIGILTDQDVTRRIAFQVPPGAPVEAVMNRSVPCIPASERLFQAVARMRRLHLHQLLVTDAAGRAVGLLGLDAALAATADTLVRRMELLSRDDGLAGLKLVKSAQAGMARELLDEHVPAPEIQSFLTDINRDLYCRVIDRALAAMADEGWGAPPVSLCVLIMGSGGRGENLLDPDQDNGFVLGDYSDDAHWPIDRFFVELAERITRDLDAIGIPYCKGGVMATSPIWRKTLPQWRAQMDLWARRRSRGATLLADIFFDFQPIHGDPAPAAVLRRHVSEVLRRERALLQSMADDDTSGAGALGLFGRLSLEGDESIHRGRIELKLRARQPLVACTRLLALATGIEETSTLERLARLGASGVVARGDLDDLVDAYGHVSTLMLRQQVADIEAGKLPGEYVEAEHLAARDRARLQGALKAIDRLRKRTQMDLVGGSA